MNDLHSLSAAYALDALDDIERAQFEKHLAVCSQCRDEVAGLIEAGSMLSHVTAAPPPPELRERVLADAARVRPLPPSRAVTTARRMPRWVAAAAVLMALAGGVTATAWQPWEQPQPVQVSLADQVRQAEDAQTWTRSLPGGAVATVVRSESVGKAVIRTSGLEAAPAGKVYQLWLQEPAGLVPAGLFSAGDSEVVLRGDAAKALGAGLTIEPSGGSPAPTTKPLVFVDFRSTT